MALAAASVAACPSEADCSLSSSSAGSRGIGVSCRPGCRKPQNRRLRPGLWAALAIIYPSIGPWVAQLPISRARCGLEPGESAPGGQASKPWVAPPGRHFQHAGRTQALRRRTVLWAGRIERCKRGALRGGGLCARGRYAAPCRPRLGRRPVGFRAGALSLVRILVGAVATTATALLLLLLLVLIFLLGALGIFWRVHWIGLWRGIDHL